MGWWRTRGQARAGLDLLPLPVSKMAFTLTDQRGQSVIPATWLGRPTMVFFGFTFCPDRCPDLCPDRCPTTLNDISDWLVALGPDHRFPRRSPFRHP